MAQRIPGTEISETLNLPKNVSESIKRLNPDLFGLGRVANPERQPDRGREGQDSELGGRPESLGYCVTIISCRRRLVDEHDNLRTGAKPLIDCITASLGFASDGDKRLKWCYEQFRTEGEQGTIVKIDALRL